MHVLLLFGVIVVSLSSTHVEYRYSTKCVNSHRINYSLIKSDNLMMKNVILSVMTIMNAQPTPAKLISAQISLFQGLFYGV
jgi:hypothetical protein